MDLGLPIDTILICSIYIYKKINNLIIFKDIFMKSVCTPFIHTHKNESKHIVKYQSFEIHVYRTHYKYVIFKVKTNSYVRAS